MKKPAAIYLQLRPGHLRSGRMTVFTAAGEARTMDYKANDVGFVPQVAGHYAENTGNDDLVFLALFKSSYFAEASLDQWLRRLPVQMLQSHLNLTPPRSQ